MEQVALTEKHRDWLIALSSGIFNIEFLEEQVFRGLDYGPAFAYLWRRFGPPINGWDEHKEVACYYLSTNRDDTIIYATPRTSRIHMFGFGLSPEAADRIAKECSPRKGHALRDAKFLSIDLKWKLTYFNDSHEVREPHYLAIMEAMAELLRPVPVRDTYINIEGRVPESRVKEEAEPFKWAGFGVVPDYFENISKDSNESRG
jgi:hypothetical protein